MERRFQNQTWRRLRPRTGEAPFDFLRRAVRTARFLYRRRRERRAGLCLRCGTAASGVCVACAALVCGRCSVVSIETGEAGLLCLGCIAPSPERRIAPRLRSSPQEMFRSGASTLGIVLVALGGGAYWSGGWRGPWRVLAFLVQPAVLFSLVPLVFVFGALGVLARRVLRAVLGKG